jgi:16S rRNA (cytidine1402-2'-O)-methyltransferase
MADNMGSERQATVARELTKTFETIKDGSLAELVDWVQADSNQQKGEFVVILQGAPARNSDIDETVEQVLTVLLAELPLKQAASLAAKITGLPKNRLYEAGLVIKEKQAEK